MRARAGRHYGFTLGEVLIASLVLLITAAAMTRAIVAGQMIAHEALHNERATALADALMAEISALSYYDPDGNSVAGPEVGENGRADFDNVDDFHGYTENAGALVDAEGNSYPDKFEAFSRTVRAVYGEFDVSRFSEPAKGITVAVTVEDQSGRAWTITRFITEPY